MRTWRDVPFALTVSAPAKLNLGLEVLGRRADGYHDLATIFLTVSLFDEVSARSEPSPQPLSREALTPGPSPDARERGDELRAEEAERIGLILAAPDWDGPIEENLVWRAAEAMQRIAPGRGALVKLEKRIPVAAGLGGASADAAATLLALRELWQVGATDEALAALALELGSDVPFLLRGGCAVGRGRGERLEALPVPGERPPHFTGEPSPPAEEPSPPAPLPMRGRGETNARLAGDDRGQSAGVTSDQDSTYAAESSSPAQRERGWGEGRRGWAEGSSGGEGPYFLIVAPRVQVPRKTASLFAALQPGGLSDGARVALQADRLRTGLAMEPALLGNAFGRALYALRPDVEAVAGAMWDAGAEYVALSGAGPAHYALFEDMAIALLVRRRLEERLGEAAEILLTVPVPARDAAPLDVRSSQP